MKVSRILYFLLFVSVGAFFILGGNGCAQIGAISGGTKDTIPPVLISASPEMKTTNFTGNRITLTFDEYIDELLDIQANVLISPYPKNMPELRSKLKTVSIKLKDTLLANTTYAINFGKILKDVNEGNILKNFTYVFSTGKTIDSLSITGKVELAETGKTDSTLFVLLYRNATDSSVEQLKPAYIAFVNGDGSFTFNHLPPDKFSIYALKDGDGSKTYNSKSEMFAFIDKPIVLTDSIKSVLLYAYEEEKFVKPAATATVKPKTAAQKKLKYTFSAASQKQDLKTDLVLDFTNQIKKFDSTKIVLSDTNFVPVSGVFYVLDSNRIILKNKWVEDADYKIVINKAAVIDMIDSSLAKSDTLRFKTRKETEYGNVVIRFNNLDLTKHPVLQFVQQDEIKYSFAITAKEWRNKLFPPGEYEIRILYDDNENGKWDPGSYSKKKQPEKVITLPKKLSIRDNWDNESDINL